MTDTELRPAFERARAAYHASLLGTGGSAFALDDAKLMLRFAARLHRDDWAAENPWVPIAEALTYPPEWRQAWKADTGIDAKEIDL